ncbi:hypothetical protein EWM64_g2350 [Hericium alpestre]|uniref:Uncharacterized protein n=1 Tax=Hericium alpestre TaxID=135208 RepID=A0A4Z0A6X0_9AGAM|nr:hypothetical protein EWM64_g2350 [Hericium alpestre]
MATLVAYIRAEIRRLAELSDEQIAGPRGAVGTESAGDRAVEVREDQRCAACGGGLMIRFLDSGTKASQSKQASSSSATCPRARANRDYLAPRTSRTAMPTVVDIAAALPHASRPTQSAYASHIISKAHARRRWTSGTDIHPVLWPHRKHEIRTGAIVLIPRNTVENVCIVAMALEEGELDVKQARMLTERCVNLRGAGGSIDWPVEYK